MDLLDLLPKEIMSEINSFRQRERELSNSDAAYFFLSELCNTLIELESGYSFDNDDSDRIKEFNNIIAPYFDLYKGKCPIIPNDTKYINTIQLDNIKKNNYLIENKLLVKLVYHYFWNNITYKHDDYDLTVCLINNKLKEYNNNLRMIYYNNEKIGIFVRIVSICDEY